MINFKVGYSYPKWQAYVTDPTSEFIFLNGSKARSIFDLKREILLIDDEVFGHHFKRDRQDVVDWLKLSLGAHSLADCLIGITNRWKLLVELELNF